MTMTDRQTECCRKMKMRERKRGRILDTTVDEQIEVVIPNVIKLVKRLHAW